MSAISIDISPTANYIQIVPTAPSNLVPSAVTTTRIDLTWTDNSNNETEFDLQHDTDNAFSSPTTVNPVANATSHSVTSLSADTVYYFRIRATNASGDSAWSATASTRTIQTLPDITDNLVSFWDLDESSGNRADSHGSNTLVDASSVGARNGLISNGANFVLASSDRLTLADNADISVGSDVSFVYAGWFYVDLVSGYYVPLSKWGTTDTEYLLDLNEPGGSTRRIAWYVRDSTDTSNVIVIANDQIPYAQTAWYFLVMGYDKDLDLVFLTTNNNVTNIDALAGGGFNGTESLSLGSNNNPGSYYDGVIDELGFWKGGILNPAETTWLYNSGSGRTYSDLTGYSAVVNAEWNHSFYTIGEHPVIKNGKVYVSMADIATSGNEGLVIYYPANGAIINYFAVGNIGAAVAIDNNGKIHAFNAADGELYRIDESTGLEETLSSLTTVIDWEAQVYDSVNDQLLVPAGTDEIRAVDSADYTTTNWTTTGMNLSSGADKQISPPLIVGGFAYVLDFDAVVWKIDLSDGSLDDSLDISAAAIDSYFALIYDEDNDRIYASNGLQGSDSAIITAIDPSDMSSDWTKTVEASAYTIFRAGAYYNNILYVTTRQTASPFRSKVYALDVLDSGNILWTNTTAFDNDAQVSAVLVDDEYVYITTYDYNADTYNKVIGLNIANGTVNFNYDILAGASSSIPCVWKGKFFIGLWDSLGCQAIRLRDDGGTGDFAWKADGYHTGYIGNFTSGSVVSH
jgi:hypothetical protein